MALPDFSPPLLHTQPLVDALTIVSDTLSPYLKAISFLKLNSIQHTTRAYQLLEAAILSPLPVNSGPDAYYQLARILETGVAPLENANRIPIEKDRYRAKSLYKAANNYPPALYRLALLYVEDGNEFEARTALIAANHKKATPDSLCMLADLLIKSNARNMYPYNNNNNYGYNYSYNAYNNRHTNGTSNYPYRAMRYYLRAAEEFGHPRATAIVCDAIIQGKFGLLSDPQRALHLYQRAAREHKCVASTIALARIMLRGTYGIRPTPAKAVKVYMHAVSSGSHVAAVELADACRRGTGGIPLDCTRAYHLYNNVIQQHAQVNNNCNSNSNIPSVIQAKFSLAYMLIGGMVGVKEDPNAAGKLFLEAVAVGGRWEHWWTHEFTTDTWESSVFQTTRANNLLDTATAMVSETRLMKILADILLVGKGLVPADPRKAGELYIRAINESNDTRSMRAVADILLTDMFDLKSDASEAMKIYTRAAENGDMHSMRDLGHVLCMGLHGVTPDQKKAVQLWEKAACDHVPTLRAIRDAGETQLATEKYTAAVVEMEGESGRKRRIDRRIYFDLANLIRESHPKKAAECYRKAGCDGALTNLAEMLLFGEIERNPQEALRLCEKAAGRNHKARAMVAYLLEKNANNNNNGNRTNGESRPHQLRKARKALKRAVDRDGRPFVHSFVKNLREKDEAAERAQYDFTERVSWE